MLRGIFALFFRSLRGESRSVWVHVSWLFLLLVIYVALCFAQEQSRFFGAPGLNFFRSVAYLNAIFVTLLGVSYFSSAISEEKEEDTLGLMTMAGISSLGILLGKSTTRLFQVFLLFAVQYPFTLLAVTLGGLMPDQIYSAYAALLAYTWLLANAGLFCSVVSRRSRDAAGLTTLLLIGYIFLPLFSMVALQLLRATTDEFWMMVGPSIQPSLAWISKTSVFSELYQVTETGIQLSWTPQLISNLLGGLFFFLISWWLFQFVSHEPATESTVRSLVPRSTGRKRLFATGRTWDWALAWKDFHFIAGGWIGVVIRCGLYIGVYWLSFAASYPWEQPIGNREIRWRDVTYGYQMFLPPLFAVDCALCASRLFQEEIRYQTLASLLMLPRSIAHLAYTKLVGCLIGLIPGMVALLTAFFLLEGSGEIFRNGQEFGFVWWYVANLLLSVHLCMLYSLYVRWGALAMAFATTFGLMFVSVICIDFMRMRGGFGGQSPDIWLGVLAVPLLMGCVVCHMLILLRLPALGEK
jgi:ABC-type transport system involved in multi-copper enzyme maturation permease subunit